MATFMKFLELFNGGEAKRAYYIYGPERVLAEECVDLIRARTNPHDMDYVSLSARHNKDAEIFGHINQYAANDAGKRLVLVREAERIKRWDLCTDWITSRTIPSTTAIFVDSRDDVDTKPEHLQRITKTGRAVQCKIKQEEKGAYISQRFGTPLDIANLITYRTGSLREARDAAGKARALAAAGLAMTPALAEALTELPPAQNFVAQLTKLNKAAALEAAAQVPPEDIGRAIGELDYRLDTLLRMAQALRRNRTARDMIANIGIPPFLVGELMQSAKHYDHAATTQRAQALATIDAHYQTGARTGLLETLVAAW
jgi:hypothetical protein